MKFFSQIGQDRFLFENFFYGRRGGVFVDVGAYDGEKFSNTLFFERYMDWRGLCIEPLPSAFAKLAAKRSAICKQVCIADFEGEDEFTEAATDIDETMLSGLTRYFDPRHVQRLKVSARDIRNHKVPVRRLSSLLAENSLTHVDYCSIDTEGSEYNIVADMDFDKYRIDVLTIENNYDDERVPRLMKSRGYDFVAKLEQDYVFKRPGIQQRAQTTVICAVWHGESRREELLRGHVANLAGQTVPIETVYIFDGNTTPPSWLDAQSVVVRQPLTIYQAWNVGLSLVGTPLVMNLNLDDRLAPDAIEVMQKALAREGAWVVGGDWKICYSQAETDNTQACHSAQSLPVVVEWPPKNRLLARLGSGTGETGTMGPAVMWRLDAHLGAPRYPWRFLEGTVIRTAGDSAWWSILAIHLKKKVLRLPIILGHYHSHPEDQAEFRKIPYDEFRLMRDIGIHPL